MYNYYEMVRLRIKNLYFMVLLKIVLSLLFYFFLLFNLIKKYKNIIIYVWI